MSHLDPYDGSINRDKEETLLEDIREQVPDLTQQTIPERRTDIEYTDIPGRPTVADSYLGDLETTNDRNYPHAETPAELRCGFCGKTNKEFPLGVGCGVMHVGDSCQFCSMTLKPRNTLVVSQSVDLSRESRIKILTEHWDREIWAGRQHSIDNYPRNREFSEDLGELADRKGIEWRPSCPLCGRSFENVATQTNRGYEHRGEYHHWSGKSNYQEHDQGVVLCSPCHKALTKDIRDGQLDDQARARGWANKHVMQLSRAVLRYRKMNETPDGAGQVAKNVSERLNTIHSPQWLVDMMKQIYTDEIALELLADKSLFPTA